MEKVKRTIDDPTCGYVLITGAGSGIGRNLALKFATLGYKIVLVGRVKEKLVQVQKQIGNTLSLIVPSDVSKKKEVDKIYNFANDWSCQLPYIVISCAGEGVFGEIGDYSQADLERVIAGNLLGTIFVSQRAFIEMKDRGGYIVNVISTSANKGDPIQSIYCASKWGAKGFTESLKIAAKKTPIKVLSVYPGCVNTPFWNNYKWLYPDTSNFMKPDEVAATIIDCIFKSSLWVADITLNRFYERALQDNFKLLIRVYFWVIS